MCNPQAPDPTHRPEAELAARPSAGLGTALAERRGATLSLSKGRELVERIVWIVRLRWVAALGVAAAITAAHYGLGIALPLAPLYGVAAALGLYNLALWRITRWLRASGPRTPFLASAFANIQISADLFFLAALLYFSGGIENPFTFYFVFHIVIASILLSRRATFFQTALASLLVLAMAVVQHEHLAPHYHLAAFVPQQVCLNPLFTYGTWFVVASTLFLTAFFATSITARLRRREADILALTRSLEEKAADLARANEQLRLTERAKSEYMRRVAHEMRSPLATLHQMVGLLLEGRKGEIPSPAADTLARVRVRLRLLMEVVRDLLVLSRAREADLSRQMQPVRLAELVAGLAPDLQQQARQAGVALEIAVPADLPTIAGDPDSLRQLVGNLASNAVKYTPAGGWVKIAAAVHGQGVELTVADSGIGIAPDELDRIFNEFYRAAGARESGKEGTGLGLSIVRAIVTAHGGEVSVESELGAGTSFRVRLPSTPPARADSEDQSP